MKKTKKIGIYWGIFLISAVFYLLFFVNDGVILTEDANSYIIMETNREPFYCSFLWLLRILFKEDVYLKVAAIIQCLVAALAAASLTVSFQSRFSLSKMATAAVLLLQYSITILNRFVAQRRYSYYNSIETEGLAYSIWIFFFLTIVEILYDKDKKAVIKAILWSIVLISIRKQMLFSLGVLLIAVLIAFWNRRKWYQSVIIAFISVLICFLGNKLIDCEYNYLTRGVFEEHTGDASFIFGTQIYMANSNMAEVISNDEYRQLFLEIMQEADKKEYHVSYAPDSALAMQEHYSLCYDRIKFDIVNPVIRAYQDEHGIPEEEREANSSLILSEMVRNLLKPTLPSIVKLFWINVLQGLVVTVSFKKQTFLYFYALIVYLFFIASQIYLVKKRNMKTLLVSFICLISILGNVVITSATIYCQTRYMLYNTALFYQVGLLILAELIQERHKYEKNENGVIH